MEYYFVENSISHIFLFFFINYQTFRWPHLNSFNPKVEKHWLRDCCLNLFQRAESRAKICLPSYFETKCLWFWYFPDSTTLYSAPNWLRTAAPQLFLPTSLNFTGITIMLKVCYYHSEFCTESSEFGVKCPILMVWRVSLISRPFKKIHKIARQYESKIQKFFRQSWNLTSIFVW